MKRTALLDLARTRQSMRLDGYGCIGDFHGGIFECEHISPYTRSADNVDAEIMVVGQDWSSADFLSRDPPDPQTVNLGYTPDLPTNKNLDCLLLRHFGLHRHECYFTNAFPFVKDGNLSAGIRFSHLVDCAGRFTLEEIRIVAPHHVLCLGQRTFNALRRASGRKGSLKLAAAIDSSFIYRQSTIHCVAHTGNIGTNNRGNGRVENDWKRIAATMKDPL